MVQTPLSLVSRSAAKLPSSHPLPLNHITCPFTWQITHIEFSLKGLPHQTLIRLLHPHLPHLTNHHFTHHAIIGTLSKDLVPHLIPHLACGHLIVDHFQVGTVRYLIQFPVRTFVQPRLVASCSPDLAQASMIAL